jgi:hypothetical protein
MARARSILASMNPTSLNLHAEAVAPATSAGAA